MMTKTRKRHVQLTFIYILLVIGCLAVFLPLSWMVITSLKSMKDITMSRGLDLFPSGPSFQNFIDVFKLYPLATYIKNSAISVGCSTVIGVAFASLAGYGLSRFAFKGQHLMLSFLLVTQMFPAVMKIIPYYKILVTAHLNDTAFGLMIVYTSFTIPFCTWMMYGYFNSIPNTLDEAAKIDGCSNLQIFRRIIFPLVMPGVVATVIYAFLQNWNEYMFASVLISSDNKKTLTYAISTMANSYQIQWNYLMSISIISSIPTLLLFIFLQKYLIAGLTAGAVKE